MYLNEVFKKRCPSQLTAAHLNAGHLGGDSVAIGIYSPSSPTSIPPSPHLALSLISLAVSVDVKHHVYLLTYLPVITITTVSDGMTVASGWTLQVNNRPVSQNVPLLL